MSKCLIYAYGWSAVEKVINEVRKEGIGKRKIWYILHADDVVLLAIIVEGLKSIIKKLQKYL